MSLAESDIPDDDGDSENKDLIREMRAEQSATFLLYVVIPFVARGGTLTRKNAMEMIQTWRREHLETEGANLHYSWVEGEGEIRHNVLDEMIRRGWDAGKDHELIIQVNSQMGNVDLFSIDYELEFGKPIEFFPRIRHRVTTAISQAFHNLSFRKSSHSEE